MKNKLLPILIFISVAICGNSRLNAQTTLTGTARAEVIESLSALEGALLNFGRFSPEEVGGKITISPDGSRYSDGSIILSGGTYNPALFYITGQPEYNVTVSLPTIPSTITNIINGKTMQINKWTSIPSLESDFILPPNGAINMTVGATLEVGDFIANPVGVYSGTYIITFSYN